MSNTINMQLAHDIRVYINLAHLRERPLFFR